MELFERLIAIGEKKAGTPAGLRAKSAIIDAIKSACPHAAIREEPFPVELQLESKASVTASSFSIDSYLYENTGASGTSVEAEVIYVGNFIAPHERHRIRNKIVVFRHSAVFHRIYQTTVAYQYGAKAVILVSNRSGHIHRGVAYPPRIGRCPIPAVGILKSEWEKIEQRLKADDLKKLRIDFAAKIEKLTSTNIIVDFPGSRPGTIVLGAHYDSWHAGAHDNCISVQILLDLIKRLKTSHSLRAIFFDAEEIGLCGSVYHVNNNDISDYKLYLNIEMPVPTRTGKTKTIWYSSHGLVKKSVRRMSCLLKRRWPISFKWYYKIAPTYPADSDAFYHKGIPCISTYCRNPHYHTVLDVKENIKLEEYPRTTELLCDIVARADRYLEKQS
jgi:hypothetical protein